MVFLQTLAADTIALKSGEKIEGRIISEDEDHYVVEVVISGSIRDERKIARTDVKFIEKQEADEKAFDGIGVQLPAPDLLDKEAYEEWISKLEEFVKAYPESQKAAEAKGMVDILGAEHAIVAAGGIKFGGQMISAEAYEGNAYEHDVRIAEKKIKDAVARRDFLSCLRMFSEYGGKFGESESRQGVAALMLQVLAAYKSSLDENLATLERRTEKRMSGLASMTPEDRSKTERALKEQMEKIESRFAKEKASGQRWVTPDSFHKPSMDDALSQVAAETTRLRGLTEGQPLVMPLAEAYRVAWSELADGTEEEKKKVLEDAKANRLTECYLEKLRIRAALAEN